MWLTADTNVVKIYVNIISNYWKWYLKKNSLLLLKKIRIKKMDNVLSSMEDMDSNSSTSDNTSTIENNYSQVVFINNAGK